MYRLVSINNKVARQIKHCTCCGFNSVVFFPNEYAEPSRAAPGVSPNLQSRNAMANGMNWD
jgi:hypothetical protein